MLSDFNTSYVTVQPNLDPTKWDAYQNFNTSYVTVQPRQTQALSFFL